jgi:small-conductance mechanosensitive channel
MDTFIGLLSTIWGYPLVSLSDGTQLAVSQIVLVIVLVIAGVFASRWIERAAGRRLEKTTLLPDATNAIRRLLFYTLIAIVIAAALSMLHVPLGAFAFISGAIAIGVGFGAQNIINNFISGWILMSERPVKIGDFVEVEGAQGTVEVIGNRSTRIRRVDGVHLLVPNSRILENTVINWTLVDRQVRTVVRVGVAYGSPVRLVEKLLYEILGELPEIRPEPKPNVIFDDFGDNALIFDAYFWCDVAGERQLRMIRSDIRFRIDALFAEHGITIAFPQRDLHFDADRPLSIKLSRDIAAADGAAE